MRDEYRKKRGLVHEVTDLRKQVADLRQAAVERRRVEDGLRHEQELLRALLNHAPHPLCLLDLEGAPLLANKPFLDLLGYGTVGELVRIGGALGLVVGQELLRQALASHQSTDITLRRSDGERLVAAVLSASVPGAEYVALTVLAHPQVA